MCTGIWFCSQGGAVWLGLNCKIWVNLWFFNIRDGFFCHVGLATLQHVWYVTHFSPWTFCSFSNYMLLCIFHLFFICARIFSSIFESCKMRQWSIQLRNLLLLLKVWPHSNSSVLGLITGVIQYLASLSPSTTLPMTVLHTFEMRIHICTHCTCMYMRIKRHCARLALIYRWFFSLRELWLS